MKGRRIGVLTRYFLKHSAQYLFKKQRLAIPLSMYTSYDANLPWHTVHDIASRFFMISEIGWTFGTIVLDCNPDAVDITSNQTSVHA
jgi:hypothetical protein